MAECPEFIDTAGPVAFACSLQEGHPGPHATVENSRSVRERKAWEEEQKIAREAAASLEQFQGRPQTTAERYTVNPTPHPDLICDSCHNGRHDVCQHRKELMEVLYAGREKVESFCSCFNSNKGQHGFSDGASAPSPTPVFDPEPQPYNEPVTTILDPTGEPHLTGQSVEPFNEYEPPSVEERIVAKTQALVEKQAIEEAEAQAIYDAVARVKDRKATRELLVESALELVKGDRQPGEALSLQAVIESTVDLVLETIG